MKALLACVIVILLVSNARLVKEPNGRYKRSQVVEAFKKAGIVPDVIPVAPPQLLGAQFENAVVSLGNEIYAGDTIGVPTLQFDVEPDCYYTFIILVTDVPSAEMSFLSPILQALYVNVRNLDLESACVVASYFPATPIPGTGNRRYILLLYKQEYVIEAADSNLAKFENQRTVFPFADFVKNYSLCVPVAGNYFVSQFPDDIESYCDLSC